MLADTGRMMSLCNSLKVYPIAEMFAALFESEFM
jgi:hypothetical protein